MKAAIIIQARINSKRLPGKIFKKINKKSLLEYLLERMISTEIPIILAVPQKEKSNFQFLKKKYSITLFGGSEDDVLNRYYLAAKKYDVKNIIRITGDNPFTSEEALTTLLKQHILKKADLSHHKELPYGSGVEIISYNALKAMNDKAEDPFEREHITQYIYRHEKSFKLYRPLAPKKLRAPELRLTVDTSKDFARFKKIVKKLGKDNQIIPLLEIIEMYSS